MTLETSNEVPQEEINGRLTDFKSYNETTAARQTETPAASPRLEHVPKSSSQIEFSPRTQDLFDLGVRDRKVFESSLTNAKAEEQNALSELADIPLATDKSIRAAAENRLEKAVDDLKSFTDAEAQLKDLGHDKKPKTSQGSQREYGRI